ncbi:Phosphatidylinositol 4-kinase pik1alpha (PI4-kinase)(PtdIns-4-kinase) [Microbotryomycetes sp. JL201]|nr:Phosphatidylinositol 4-kinase pik1alpha (PI4-kinase)(PtdIns-4-kinase) [Microbotryomycetes sp. JL201]
MSANGMANADHAAAVSAAPPGAPQTAASSSSSAPANATDSKQQDPLRRKHRTTLQEMQATKARMLVCAEQARQTTRPVRHSKNNDQTLTEKFKNVEKSISMMLHSINSGAAPDPVALSQLQASLAEGLAAGEKSKEKDNKDKNSKSNTAHHSQQHYDGQSPSSGSDSQPGGARNPNKRARHDSNAALHLSPSDSSPFIGSMAMSPASAPSTGRLPQLQLEMTPRSKDSMPLSARPPSAQSSGGPLSMLADASLAAQIDGRSQLKGLEPDFNLSRVTEAIQDKPDPDSLEETRTPAILSKRIVTPEMAVEMFRLFFDWAYIHLPLLDPAQNTATSVCARSPFLFTAICAVASRFNSDSTLHVKCYDEVHNCFIETIASGERSIEIVQACMILTMWGSAPKGTEDRPQRAWMYFGMAVRMSLELGLFRPPAFVDAHLKANAGKANPWVNLKHVPEEQQREALNRERTWLLVFVMDRYMSAVMGRPYQIHEAKPIMLPAHPMALPFDLGVIAHAELQEIVGQVMDTFRDRIYGLPSASDEMPSATVMKLFNSRMDEWRQRWCPVPGEPIANNLLFYFFSSKLFLNSIPLHTMLRNGDGSDDPASVSSTITAAKSIMEIAHEYAKLGVLLHCPDVNFLLLLYAAVFLVKVKVSNTRFSDLVDADELQKLLITNIQDCQAATCSERHAAATCNTLLRALLTSWKAMSQAQAQQMAGLGVNTGNGTGSYAGMPGHYGIEHFARQHQSLPGHPNGSIDHSPQIGFNSPALGLQGTLSGIPAASNPASPAAYPFMHTPFASGAQRASVPSGNSYFGTAGGGGSGSQTPAASGGGPGGTAATVVGGGASGAGGASASSTTAMEPLDSFLSDTNFWNGIMVSQGSDGFFSWETGFLKTYPNSIGITHYLVNRLRKFADTDVEFYWPQLIYLVITRPTPSVALENFILERCETNAHIAVISLWYLQASLFDLSSSPKTDQFAVCRRLYNRVQAIIFTDPPLPPASTNTSSTVSTNGSQGGDIQLAPPKTKLNAAMASFVGLGIVAAAVAQPKLAEASGSMAIEQGRRIDADQSSTATASADAYESDEGANSGSEDERAPTDARKRSIAGSSKGAVSRSQTMPTGRKSKPHALPNYLPGDRLVPSAPAGLAFNDVKERTSSHSYLPARTPVVASGSSLPKSKAWPNGGQPPTASPMLSSGRRRSLVPGSSAQASHSTPTLPSLSASLASRSSSYMQGSTMSNAQLSGSTLPGYGLPKAFLSRILLLQACRSQLDLLRSLQDISTRLVLVPRPARLSSLRAELTVLNHGLPRGCSLGMPTIGFDDPLAKSSASPKNQPKKQTQARIVRISPSESVVLNSADRAPFVIHVEVLENDLDFDPDRRQNAEDLRRALQEREVGTLAGDGGAKRSAEAASQEMRRGGSLGSNGLPSPNSAVSVDKMFTDGGGDVATAAAATTSSSTKMSRQQSTELAMPQEPKEEMDLVEQLYGDVSIHDAVEHDGRDEEEEIRNRDVDEQAWARTDSVPKAAGGRTENLVRSRDVFSEKADATTSSVSSSTAAKMPPSTALASASHVGRGAISLDDYAERMRMAAVMLAQLDASQQASKGVVATGTAAAGTLVGLPVATVAGIGGVVGAGLGAVATRLSLARSTSSSPSLASSAEAGQASQGTTVGLDTTSAASGTSAVAGAPFVSDGRNPSLGVGAAFSGTGIIASGGATATPPQGAIAPRPRVLAPADAAAIRDRIMSEMMALEEERMSRMKADGRARNRWRSSSTTEDGAVVMRAVNKDDPSGAVFAESWSSKVARIRGASPYGHLANWNVISVIVKTGADLRQEQFAVQLIREFGRIWQEEKLSAWVCYFRILVTSERSGLIETITDTVSVHSIKKEAYAQTAADGSQVFPAFTLYDHYVNTYGPPESARFRKAQDAFCKSLASYSVICYLLQLKDRHNGNILIDKDGHLIHIDFGFILSNSPGSIGFEMAPFKLPQDYIDILGGFDGDKFAEFKTLFKRLFQAARKHAERIITLVELMQKGDAGEQTAQQLRERFVLSLTQSQVEEFCDRLVINSATSSFTRLYDLFQGYSNGIL